MEDEAIIELFFARSESAIKELDLKYGKVCCKISSNILHSLQDAEECINDAYLGVWNTIPPERPNPLLAFLCKIVRNEYVVEAVTYQHIRKNFDENIVKRARHSVKKTKKFVWIKWGTMAACFVAATVLTFFILPNNINQQGVTTPDNQIDVVEDISIDDTPNDDAQSAATEIHISMSDVIMNDIDIGVISSWDYARYNPETDNRVVWNKEDIEAYYETDLTPAYIPDGLSASPLNYTATVYIGQDGTVVEDTVGLSFYHAYYEDGGPKLTEDIAACYGFSLTI